MPPPRGRDLGLTFFITQRVFCNNPPLQRHSHIGLLPTKLSLLAVSVPRQTILCRSHLSRPAKSSKPHGSSPKTCRRPSSCPPARPPSHRPISAELSKHFASLHLDDAPLINKGPKITAPQKPGGRAGLAQQIVGWAVPTTWAELARVQAVGCVDSFEFADTNGLCIFYIRELWSIFK